MGDRTDISKSTKTFTVEDYEESSSDVTKEITINQLQTQPPFQKVSLSAKVIEIDEIATLQDGRKVQNIMISDSTGTAKVALWEDSINSVKLLKSYKFVNLTVKNYHETNTLFTPRKNFSTTNIDDLQEVCPLIESIKRSKTLQNAKVIAVTNFKSVILCLQCNPGSISLISDSDTLGNCNNCSSIVAVNSCKLATITISVNGFHFRRAPGKYQRRITSSSFKF